MAKRFTDTEIWKHEWFTELTPAQKCLWRFLCDNCDGATGICPLSFKLASFQIGCEITMADVKALGDRAVMIGSDKVWLPGFIPFQYKKLNPKNGAHRGMMRTIVQAVGHLPLEGESKVLIESFKAFLADPQSTLDRESTDSTGNGNGKGNGKVSSEGGAGETDSPAIPKDAFLAIYEIFPRKQGKDQGLIECVRQIRSSDAWHDLMKAAENYAEHIRDSGEISLSFKGFLGNETEGRPWIDWLEDDAGNGSRPKVRAGVRDPFSQIGKTEKSA